MSHVNDHRHVIDTGAALAVTPRFLNALLGRTTPEETTMTNVNVHTCPHHRAQERAEIERQLADWLGNGNTIAQLPSGVSSENGHRFKSTVKPAQGGKA